MNRKGVTYAIIAISGIVYSCHSQLTSPDFDWNVTNGFTYYEPWHSGNEAWVVTNGDNLTASFGMPSLPFQTIEAALAETTNRISAPWIIHIGPGQFRSKRSMLISNGCVIIGAGRDVTEIVGNFPLNSHGPTVNPMDNCQLYDLTISAQWTSSLAAPFGAHADAFSVLPRPFTNVYLRNVRLIGHSDNFYVYQTNRCRATFDHCAFGGSNNWDLIATAGSSNSIYTYDYCSFSAKGPPLIGTQTRVGNLFEGTNIFNHCTIVSESGIDTTYGFEMHHGVSSSYPAPLGALELNDCTLYTASSSGTVLDIVNSVSASVIVRGAFDTNRCIGPITVEPYAGPIFKGYITRSGLAMPPLPPAPYGMR